MSDTTPDIKTTFSLSNTVYDKLKFLALVLLPALATLYFTIGELWGLPYVTQVIGTIVAVETFLGLILKLSTTVYKAIPPEYSGTLTLGTDEAGTEARGLEFNKDLSEFASKDNIVIKVVSN